MFFMSFRPMVLRYYKLVTLEIILNFSHFQTIKNLAINFQENIL